MDVLKVVHGLGKREFTNRDAYAFSGEFGKTSIHRTNMCVTKFASNCNFFGTKDFSLKPAKGFGTCRKNSQGEAVIWTFDIMSI